MALENEHICKLKQITLRLFAFKLDIRSRYMFYLKAIHI